jgi:GNAT superfamily N-acetyltransferase
MSESAAAPASVYALLADGRTVEIRPAARADYAAVKAMHEAMSPNNSYLRFFSLSRLAAEQEARRVTREPGPDHAALLALYDGGVVGLASFEVARKDGRTAEVAFAVADTMHHRGIATLLLEHLVSLARARQLEALTAETLQENTGMLRVFSDAGLPVESRREDGVVAITIPLPPDDAGRQLDDYLETVAGRERSANVASLRPLFAPGSVAVIGVSRRTGTVGRSVLENIQAGGYAGQLYAVNPRAVPAVIPGGTTPRTPRLRYRATLATALLRPPMTAPGGATPRTHQGRLGGFLVSAMSRACRRRRTSRCSPSRPWRSSTLPRPAGGAGCAGSSCLPLPSTRRSAPTCLRPAAGTGCA